MDYGLTTIWPVAQLDLFIQRAGGLPSGCHGVDECDVAAENK